MIAGLVAVVEKIRLIKGSITSNPRGPSYDGVAHPEYFESIRNNRAPASC